MLLYIRGKEHGKELYDLVMNGPFQFGTVDVLATLTTTASTRPRTFDDLTDKEKICETCDIRATNIVLQGLPPDVYTLVNHHTVAKEIWDIVKLLIEGTELSLQERELKLYNEFDRFTSEKGEIIHSYYLRFAQLINDMNTIGMTMKKLQVNTKFVNNLHSEWSKFGTDVKLAKDMHKSSFDQLYAYLRQHEVHANEVHMMRQRFSDPLTLSSAISQQQFYTSLPQPQPNKAPIHQQSYPAPVVHQQYYQAPAIHQQSLAVFPQLDSCLVVPSFLPTDDPTASLNKAMSFISTSFAS
ncbi:hypothetical protein Tco_0471354 [Tanacetum coccineum]